MISIRVDNAILDLLLEIERNNVLLDVTRLPVVISERLRKNSRKKSSYASVRIEGNPLTEDQASAAIDSATRHFLKPEQEVRNYYRALEYLDAQLKERVPFTRELVLAVQRLVVDGESSEKIGLRGPMPPGVLFAVYDEVSGRPDYIPPQAADLESLLDELVDYVNTSSDHPIIKAGIVHYQLVTIHPFEDGNGRTARLMSDYLISLGGYTFNRVGSLEEYFAYDIDEYYRSLQMGLPVVYYDGRENPPHPEIWMMYFLRMVVLHAKRAVELARASKEERCEPTLSHLSSKERTFYDYLKAHRIKVYRPIELAAKLKVSNRTIVNWSAALVKNGLLTPDLAGKRILSYTLAQ